jgi:hypothetical protein
VVAQTYNFSIQEAKTGGLQVHGHFGLHSEILSQKEKFYNTQLLLTILQIKIIRVTKIQAITIDILSLYSSTHSL